MTPVYQTIIDNKTGNCLEAAMASLLDMKLEEVDKFKDDQDNDWFWHMTMFLKYHNYQFDGTLYNTRFREVKPESSHAKQMDRFHEIKNRRGINGYFLATVLSPKYFDVNSEDVITHAVIIDRDFNIVHDPNPENKNYVHGTKPEQKKSYPYADVLGYNGVKTVMLIEDIFAIGNRLITQFMGAEIKTYANLEYAHFGKLASPSMYNQVTFDRNMGTSGKYQHSFDWLIPVAEKILRNSRDLDITEDDVRMLTSLSYIDFDVWKLWNAVVGVIYKNVAFLLKDIPKNDK